MICAGCAGCSGRVPVRSHITYDAPPFGYAVRPGCRRWIDLSQAGGKAPRLLVNMDEDHGAEMNPPLCAGFRATGFASLMFIPAGRRCALQGFAMLEMLAGTWLRLCMSMCC